MPGAGRDIPHREQPCLAKSSRWPQIPGMTNPQTFTTDAMLLAHGAVG